MPSELVVCAVHEGGMRFAASTGPHQVTIDYPLRPGEAVAGPTPLQLLLASLAACSGSTVALVLGRMQKPLESLEVHARGQRRDEHPTVVTDIDLEFVLKGDGLDSTDAERALKIAEEQLCPVWAMLKPGTNIKPTLRLV
ncbi:MAG: OsmC family protein [Actinobacteria bacterium]|nr:OsmC family protein [Actinomycetota bacterium]